MNQFLGMFALMPVEKALNALAQRDEYIAKQFGKFEGKVLEVNSSRPTLNITIRFEDDRLKLSAIDCETLGLKADAVLSASSTNLVQLLFQDPEDRPLANDKVNISGDATLVQDIYKTADELDVDWGDLLTPIFGDLIGNEAQNLHSNSRQWSATARENIERNIDEYLTEEAEVIPHRTRVESFANDVDRLKLRIDRARAQAELLEKRLLALHPEQ